MVLPELAPPMMHIHIAERKRIKMARAKERRDICHRAATVQGNGEERTSRLRDVSPVARGIVATGLSRELIGRNSWLGQVYGDDQGNEMRLDWEKDDHVRVGQLLPVTRNREWIRKQVDDRSAATTGSRLTDEGRRSDGHIDCGPSRQRITMGTD